MRRSRWPLAIVAGLLVIGLGAAFSLKSGRVENVLVPPAAESRPTGTPWSLSATERAFYDSVAPPMRGAAAESERLAQLGESHSRNVLELQTRSNRLTSDLAAIDAVLKVTPVPDRFADAAGLYRQAATALTATMSEARKAFEAFDFAALARAVEGFRAGAGFMREAVSSLDAAAGRATPVPDATR